MSTTLFVGNLNDRISASDLVALLYERFVPYGQIVGVKRGKRGEAFVSYRTSQQAAKAMKSCQGSVVLGKAMRIDVAKKSSDSVAKLAGSYKPKFKPKNRD